MSNWEMPVIKTAGEYTFDEIVEEIRSFQDGLSDEMEIGLVVNGAGHIIHVNAMKPSGQIVVFYGTDAGGREARLLQHYTQINLQLVAVEKLQDKAKRIGF